MTKRYAKVNKLDSSVEEHLVGGGSNPEVWHYKVGSQVSFLVCFTCKFTLREHSRVNGNIRGIRKRGKHALKAQ